MSWDIKIYEDKGIVHGGLHNFEEMETIRGLSESQKIALVTVLKRHGIKHYCRKVETQ